MRPRGTLLFITCCLILTTALGCESFRKKFVRKAKEDKGINVVIDTYEYASQLSIEDKYAKYFLFWKGAQQELVREFNAQETNRKRRVFLAEEAVDNLEQLYEFLSPEKQKEMGPIIAAYKELIPGLDEYRPSTAQLMRAKSAFQKQGRKIKNNFSPQQIKDSLIKQ